PDITIYLNGLPLAFMEVKKPNNLKGMQAEYQRMTERSTEAKFRTYINETQLMLFSNNMEYNDRETVPISGAFYATAAYGHLFFSHFREEDPHLDRFVRSLDEAAEAAILRDTNMAALRSTAEYPLNRRPDTPTNRLLTSLFSPERLLFLLHYGFNYVTRTNAEGVQQLEKHVMRYQQFFATLAILHCIDGLQQPQGYTQPAPPSFGMVAESPLPRKARGGVIWHTQGSGKTELAYYNVHVLADYYAAHHIAAKFYFIVDRLDLMTQAANEFRARGLTVVEVGNRAKFIENLQSLSDQTDKGGLVMNVVNIQRFSDEAVAKAPVYNVRVQRIYFIDEAHRDFKETGEYLARLVNSDRQAIKFALTGTPLIGKVKTKDLFGDYLHKYYYNTSIKDGYTLRLIREGIKTEYRLKLEGAANILDQKVEKGSLQKKDVTSQPEYVQPLVDYVEEDFIAFRLMTQDTLEKQHAAPVGGMIVCDSSEQAQAVQKELARRGHFRSSLILSTIGETKEELTEKRDAFKRGETDLLVVYNMLLTGFDAPRLKKMYLGRKIKAHNLLQALTRVNRPYKGLRYGYVVDFADIRQEFDKTNKAYLAELQEELGDSYRQYSSIFKTTEEIEQDLTKIRDQLFSFDTDNLERFEQEIDAIEEKQPLYELRHALDLYRELHNLSELFGYQEILERLEPEKVRRLLQMINLRIETLNQQDLANGTDDMEALIEASCSHLTIHFHKVSEGELSLADGYYEKRNRTLGEFARNQDKKDPEYIALKDELRRVLENHDMREMTLDEMKAQDEKLTSIRQRIQQVNAYNQRLADEYGGDNRFMRLHKHLAHHPYLQSPAKLFGVLAGLKQSTDDTLLHNVHLLENEAVFEQLLRQSIRKSLKTAFPDIPLADRRALTKAMSVDIYQEYSF
ncbi:UvrB domain 3-containing protein, partial [uncultured Megasphaera sp.]